LTARIAATGAGAIVFPGSPCPPPLAWTAYPAGVGGYAELALPSGTTLSTAGHDAGSAARTRGMTSDANSSIASSVDSPTFRTVKPA
jgi:hypothetical protein